MSYLLTLLFLKCRQKDFTATVGHSDGTALIFDKVLGTDKTRVYACEYEPVGKAWAQLFHEI